MKKILQLSKDFLLPAFWLFFFIAFSSNNKSEIKKPDQVKAQEKINTSSEVIRTAQNKNTSIDLLR